MSAPPVGSTCPSGSVVISSGTNSQGNYYTCRDGTRGTWTDGGTLPPTTPAKTSYTVPLLLAGGVVGLVLAVKYGGDHTDRQHREDA